MSTETDQFKAMWEEAVKKYEKSIGRTLSGDETLIKQLESPENLAEHVKGEQKKFIESRRRSELASRLKVVAKPIIALSTVAQSAIGLSPFAPASVIFGAIVYLVQATSGVSDAYDWIDDLFDKLGESDFAIRLSLFCENGVHPRLHAKIVEILVCLLEILAISEKEIRSGRWKKYAKVVISGADDTVKASFDRLAKLLKALDGLVLTINFATSQSMEKKTDEMLEIVKGIERKHLLDWLSPTDFQTRQEDALARKEDDTGQWFLDSPDFNRWVGGPKQILFCPGMPGAGKTMMVAIAIDQLITQVRNESNAVVFVYCNYKTTVDKGATAILRALLRQLVQLRPLIPEHVFQLYNDKSNRGSKLSSREVLRTLQLVLKGYSKIHVIVDALDECKDERGVRPQLLKKLHILQGEADLRLMITSRFTSEVEKEFGKVPTLEVRAREEDVRQFVAGQTLPDCITENEDLQSLVIDKIVDAAEGMLVYQIPVLTHHELITT
jgi:fungal STAND N-terminal Goodbye domain/AAA domain